MSLLYVVVVISYYCRPLAQSIFERHPKCVKMSWYFDSDIVWNCKYIWIKVQPAQPRPLFPLFPEGWEGPQGSWDLDSTAGALNSGRLGLWAWRGRHSGFLSFSQPEAQWNPQKKSGYARCAALWLLFCQWFGWCFFRRQLQEGIGLIWMKTSHDIRPFYQTCKPLLFTAPLCSVSMCKTTPWFHRMILVRCCALLGWHQQAGPSWVKIMF